MDYLFHILIYIEIYALLALGLKMLTSHAGMISLAQAAFFSIGGYSYALIAPVLGFFPALVVAILIAAGLSLFLSLSSWRLRGDYFVLGTIAFQELIFSTINNWTDNSGNWGTLKNLTNGPHGIQGVPRPGLFGMLLDSQMAFFFFATIILLIASLMVRVLIRSPWGRLLEIINDDEIAAKGLGKNTRKAKVQVFLFSSSIASIAGIIYASYVGFIDPSMGNINTSILILSMLIVGGFNNRFSPILGAGLLILIPEALRFVAFPDIVAANIRMLLFGVVLILVVHLNPINRWKKLIPKAQSHE